MGIIYSRLSRNDLPDTGEMGAPPLRTPFSDVTAPLGHFATKCGDFELRFLDCMEAHGHMIGREKCKYLFQDFRECASGPKQLKRIELMRNERNRQAIQRIMNGEKACWYADPPPIDSWGPEPTNDPQF